MCSVIGYWPLTPLPEAKEAFERLFREGSVRGLHAFGLADLGGLSGSIRVVRSHTPGEITAAFNPELPTIAHTRYSLSGDWHTLENNQPIVFGTRALAFNGVISMKTKEE